MSRAGLTLGLRVLLLSLLAMLSGAPGAAALERDPTYENGPRTPFNVFGGIEEDTADVPGLPPTASTGGLTVIGDSVAVSVPYVRRAADSGLRAHLRAWTGWTTRFHRMVTSWPSSDRSSFDAAVASDAGAVFVALGTNDVGCLKEFVFCPGTRDQGALDYQEFHRAETATIDAEVDEAVRRLVEGGKCVLWAGPRPRSIGYAPTEDVDALNTHLRQLQNVYPGRFTYVDYAAYSAENPALRADFADPDSDGMHPRTEAGRAAIADLAVTSALANCPVTTEPRVAVSPPLPPPEPLTRAEPVPPTPESVPLPQPEPLPEPPAPQPRLEQPPPPAPRCSDGPDPASRRACLRARAVAGCHSSSALEACMLRVRRLYGVSTGEARAVRRCATRPRRSRARCRATARRTYRLR